MEQDKILRWLIYFFVVSISLFTLGVAFHIFALLFERYNISKNWDMLGFTGAIIGGALTLFGVSIQIRNQRRDEYIRSFPLRLKSLDELIQATHEIHLGLNILIGKNNLTNISTLVSDFIEKQHDLTNYAITADIRAYDTLTRCTHACSAIRANIKFESLLTVDELVKNVVIPRSIEITGYLNKLISVKEELVKRYNSYLK